MELTIRITDEEADRLYYSSMHCFYHEQQERFEYVNKDDEKSNIMDTFNSSHIMHFCNGNDNIMNAVFLKNYFVTKGIKCVILWARCSYLYSRYIWRFLDISYIN